MPRTEVRGARSAHEAEQGADQQIACRRRARLLGDVCLVEQAGLDPLRAETRTNKLGEDLRGLGIDLTGPFTAARFGRDRQDVVMDARREIRRAGQSQGLLDVLFEDAAVGEGLHGGGETNGRCTAEQHVCLGLVAVRLEQRPHAPDCQAHQQAGDERPRLARDSSQLGGH